MRLQQHLDRLCALKYRLSWFKRKRFWRGHGVHSPFVYNMVRDAFMGKKLIDGKAELYDLLRSSNIATKRTAREIQNLYTYCKHRGHTIYDSQADLSQTEMVILRSCCSESHIQQVAAALEGSEHKAAVIISPHSSSSRHKMCMRICDKHQGVSIDKFNILILVFDDHYLKQHYKI